MKPAYPKSLDRPTVLMVESDVLIRQPVAEYLRECGYRVVECGNVDEVLLILGAEVAEIDVVFADAQAPGRLDGFGLARQLRRDRPEVKVILAGTIANQAKEAADLCEEGPQLSKPYDPQLLVDRIRRALAARDRGQKPEGN
jgi:CheY-like chemotaxis protein